MKTFEYQLTTKIIYGRGSSAAIGGMAKQMGLKKVQVISDAGVVKAGIAGKILDSLKESGIEAALFDRVDYNPTVQAVDQAKERYTEERCQGVIAVGGGSPMDVGKSVGVLVNNPGSAAEYLGMGKVKNPGVPVICIPTTAGTAAEITDVAVLSVPEKKAKLGLRSPQVAATVALLDPLLTMTLPPAATRESGMDALAHAVESYINLKAWEPTEALSLMAIELVGRHLRTAVHNGADADARDGMLKASLFAGMGFHSTWPCLVHAITGPMGGLYNLPHGAANGIVLPHAMKFLLPGAVGKFARIAGALGENVSAMTEREAADRAVSAVEQLSRDVGLPKGLSTYGVLEGDLPGLSELIVANPLAPLSPRLASAEEIVAICKASL